MVLKPADLDEAELEWQARIYPQVRCDGFRLAAPRAAISGSLCVEGLVRQPVRHRSAWAAPGRPAGYASAIVVADALVWEGAGSQILDAVSHVDDFGQYLIRALIFRLVTDWLLTHDEPPESGTRDDPWAPAVDLACQIAALR